MEASATGRGVGFFLDKYMAGGGAEHRDRLHKLASLHEKYRRRARLSAPLPPEAYVVHLILDSLKLLVVAPPEPGAAVADVGSGGGYPGLPLAIARGDVNFTLIEPSPRKAEYLRLAAAELGLANVTVEGRPAQELEGGNFDVACSKAVAAEIALKLMLPLVRPGGRVALFLGDYSEKALATLEEQARAGGGRLVHAHFYELPTLDRPRLLAQITRE